jgi:hypothetical protein
VCRRCGSGKHVQRRPPHDRLRRQSPPTNRSRSPMPAASACARSSGASKSRNVQIGGWPATAPRGLSSAGSEPSDGVVELDTSCRPIRTTRRSATSRSAPTRRLSASRRPVSMTAIVNMSDTASPGVARWSASIALPHCGVAKCPQAGPLAGRASRRQSVTHCRCELLAESPRQALSKSESSKTGGASGQEL